MKTINDLWAEMLIKEGIAPTAGKTINDMLFEMLDKKLLGRKGVVKSGQLTSYADYDDGYYQKGLPISGDRFVDLGTGIIKDYETGLEWIKQPELIIPGASIITSNQIQVAKGNYATATVYALANLVKDVATGKYYVCIIAHTSDGANVAADLVNNPASWVETVWTNSAANLTTPKTMAWAAALTNCKNLVYAGHSDWRLANVKEKQSIVDYGRVSPAIDPIFPNCQSDLYWSGTTYADGPGVAWFVYFSSGIVSFDDKTYGYYVRPVRSSQ